MDWGHAPSFDSADFLTLPCNMEAAEMLSKWPDWPLHAIALVGSRGSGKTHLGRAWLQKADAELFSRGDDIIALDEGASVLVDDADDNTISDEDLFHLYNWTRETGGSLLVTGVEAPNRWRKNLPDLTSRLATLPVLEIGTPDEVTLEVILQKQLSDRQLSIKDNVMNYTITHMQRSFAAARELVSALDKKTLAEKKNLTIPVVKEVLSELADPNGL